MTSSPLTDSARAFLRTAAPAVVATIGRHGQPVSAATWYVLQDDDTILINMASSRARVGHVRRDPRVALTVLGEDWYQHVSVQGHVTEIRDDPALSDIDRIAKHYTGKEYPDREMPRVSAVIAIDSWYGWHAG